MSTPGPRSVKIGEDERTGWSSDRPRRPGEAERPPRPIDVSVRCRVLPPTDRMRYSPGSLLLVAGGEPGAPDELVKRVVEDKGSVLSLAKLRPLLKGRVADEEVEEKAHALLVATVGKRLEAGDSVTVPLEGLSPAARRPLIELAAKNRRPRHLVLVETGKDKVAEEDRILLNDLRKALDAGQLGEEGFMTALRLGGTTVRELKKIIFAPPPSDD